MRGHQNRLVSKCAGQYVHVTHEYCSSSSMSVHSCVHLIRPLPFVPLWIVTWKLLIFPLVRSLPTVVSPRRPPSVTPLMFPLIQSGSFSSLTPAYAFLCTGSFEWKMVPNYPLDGWMRQKATGGTNGGGGAALADAEGSQRFIRLVCGGVTDKGGR